jgi:hypothetical protein
LGAKGALDIAAGVTDVVTAGLPPLALNAWIFKKYRVPFVRDGMDTVVGNVLGKLPLAKVDTVVHVVPLVERDTT